MNEQWNRVLVIGSSGAGKSVFSVKLAAITGLPLINLDREYWKPGWVQPDAQDWTLRVKALVDGERWVMDGNYAGSLKIRLARADTVILLNPPRSVCLYRAVIRSLRGLGRTRPDMAPGCPERLDLAFFRYVWNFRRDQYPRVTAALAGYHGRLIILDRSSDGDALLASLGKLSAAISRTRL